MSAIDNEFARPVRLDELGDGERALTIAADEAECTALARRFDIVSIGRLTADAQIKREGAIVTADGTIDAAVTQSCVATGEPLAATLRVPFSLRFVPEAEVATQEELELSESDCDILGYAGSAIDLGEAVAETLALALDPFPRSPDADAALRAAGVLEEGEAGPFGVLKALRDKLGG